MFDHGYTLRLTGARTVINVSTVYLLKKKKALWTVLAVSNWG